VDLGARGFQGGGRRPRPGETDDLMTCAEEFGNDGRADPPGRTGDENAHENLHNLMSATVITTIAVMSAAVIN
jgi:hypothetical protein